MPIATNCDHEVHNRSFRSLLGTIVIHLTSVISTISNSESNGGIFILIAPLGTVHYLWRGVAPKRNVFRGKNFADPTIKKVKNLITQPQISIKK